MSQGRTGGTGAPPRISWSLLAALVAGLVFVGGAVLIGTLPRSQSSASPTSGTSTSNDATQAPVLGLDSATYSCGGIKITPPTAAASTAPSGADPAFQTVEKRLPAILPASGWYIAASSGGDVMYVAPNTLTPAPYSFVLVETASSGTWIAMSWGDCEPAVPPTVPNSDLRPVYWSIAQPPTSTTTALKLQFQTNLCGDAFVGPTVWYSPTGVTITFWARHDPTGPQPTCLSTVMLSPFTLTLAEPLGKRPILSGPPAAGRLVQAAPSL